MEIHSSTKIPVLVCTECRPAGSKESCGEMGRNLFFTLRAHFDKENLDSRLMVLPTGCFGGCERPPAILLPFNNEVICGIKPSDTSGIHYHILKELSNGKPWISKI